MAVSKEEIARDILVASLAQYKGRIDGAALGKEFRAILKEVGEGLHEERQTEAKRP